MEIKLPIKCKDCMYVGIYDVGPYARNPHCCCELIWQLIHEDYKVDPDVIDEKCPLKDAEFVKHVEKIANSLGITLGGFVNQ